MIAAGGDEGSRAQVGPLFEADEVAIEAERGVDVANVEMDVASVPLSSKRATALALIVNELVSNAVKHACRNGKGGKIRLSLRQQSEDLVLRVRDNGPGLPADFDLARDSHVGLDVVRTLAERDLNGCFNLTDDGGVLAEVRFVW